MSFHGNHLVDGQDWTGREHKSLLYDEDSRPAKIEISPFEYGDYKAWWGKQWRGNFNESLYQAVLEMKRIREINILQTLNK